MPPEITSRVSRVSSTNPARPQRSMVLAVAILAPATVLCLRTVDRPAALYLHRIGYSTALGNRAEQVFPILIAAGGALIVLFVAFGTAVLMGRSLRPWMLTTLRGSTAGLAALGAAELLKVVFGRSPVYPTYLVEGVSRFQPLHPGTFPSATTAASAAILVVLWGAWPRGRIGYVLLLALIGAAILVTNAHWVSDVVGGLLLGAVVSWALAGVALARQLRHNPRLEQPSP